MQASGFSLFLSTPRMETRQWFVPGPGVVGAADHPASTPLPIPSSAWLCVWTSRYFLSPCIASSGTASLLHFSSFFLFLYIFTGAHLACLGSLPISQSLFLFRQFIVWGDINRFPMLIYKKKERMAGLSKCLCRAHNRTPTFIWEGYMQHFATIPADREHYVEM